MNRAAFQSSVDRIGTPIWYACPLNTIVRFSVVVPSSEMGMYCARSLWRCAGRSTISNSGSVLLLGMPRSFCALMDVPPMPERNPLPLLATVRSAEGNHNPTEPSMW